jgi:hypothetical protein
MTQPAHPVLVGTFPLARLLFLVACILFVIAALIAGGVFSTGNYLPWVLGGFAAVALGWAVT